MESGHWGVPGQPGTSLGHVVPGIGFLFAGLRFFGQFVYENTVERHLPYPPRALHSRLDIIVCLVVAVAGMFGEINNGHFLTKVGILTKVGADHTMYAWVQEAHSEDAEGHPQEGYLHSNFNNVQHILLYFSYILVAIFALLERAYPRYVPSHLGMVMLIATLLIDGFQWYIHSISKPAVHCMQHMVFAVLSFAAAIGCSSEVWSAKRALLGARSLLFTLTGVWFLTMAALMKTGWPVDIVFFGRSENIVHHDTMQLRAGPMMMINAALFSAECLVVMLLLTGVYAIAQMLLSRKKSQGGGYAYDTVTTNPCSDSGNLRPSSNRGTPTFNVEISEL